MAFEIVESPIPELVGAYAVIWTTTPWTIPVNQAIAYGPDIEYVDLSSGHERVSVRDDAARICWTSSHASAIRAASLLERPARSAGHYARSIDAGRFKGSDLAGTIARHPMHHLGGFFAEPRPFLPGDHVTTDAGTGLVHMSPDHGEEDFLVCKAAGIDPVFAVDG